MKILLLGKNGQVGWELQRSLALLGELIALGRKGNAAYCGDLTRPEALRCTLEELRPDVIVNAAAYTAVEKAEKEPELCSAVNSKAPAMLADYAASHDALLVHYSTDYVFDGSGVLAWVETDSPAPINVYGQTKLGGEEAILRSGCRHLILRTSWVYGVRGNNFVKKILRLAQEKESLSVVVDQVGAPTGADLLADITAHLIREIRDKPDLKGLYHVAASGETSWYDYACFILEQAQELKMTLRVGPQDVVPIHTKDFPTLARRPFNSRLNTVKLQKVFVLQLPHWQFGVWRLMQSLSLPQS